MDHPPAIDHAIRALAETQHGLVARRQLLLLGLGPAAIAHRVRTGRLVPVGRGVYALGHRPATAEARWMGAVLVVGSDARLAERSAGALWGIRGYRGARTHVAIPSSRGRHPNDGLVVHRWADLRPDECTVEHGIPVTTVARTLIDLAVVLRPHQLRRAVERADELELFHLPDVERSLERRRGRPGHRVMRALLDDAREHGLPRTRTDLESLFLQMCLDHGLPRPQVNRWDGKRELDFRWPDQRLVVETDGWGAHRTRRAFESDSDRSQVLAAGGWTLIRVTWRQLERRPDLVAERVHATLRRLAGR